jgi:hypothetical protein
MNYTPLRSIPRPNTRHTFYSLNLRQLGHLEKPIFTQKQWALIIGAGVYIGFFVYCVVMLIRIALTF